jgi:leucyl aminopeptidase
VEGYLLSQYKFDKYKKSSDSHNSQPEILVSHSDENELNTLKTIVSAVFKARDLVNEPSNAQTATQLAKSFEALGLEAGFTTEILGKSQIESQKMGGLMAVNKGSQEPPSFSIMNYKPENAVNKQPYILVGKGVVFDTGGLSLKPTPNSMDYMKCDMAGSAVVGAVMYGIALLKLPVWVMGLVPATDNRPGENAICPGDVITTLDGTTVEVLNTDAEGRLILCDALSFAKKYDPQMVFDFATLTGAAANALSSYGCAVMGTASESLKNELKESGDTVYERMAELPLWPEYGDEMKGEISDLKNLGKGAGGAQSAAMFLKHFTSYQWLHFDIAGTSFAHAPKGYISQGGTGFGVRMMLNYFTKKYNGK